MRRAPDLVAEPIAGRRLRQALDAWVATSPGETCALVVDDRGETLWQHRADASMVPASTIKLLTATAVLEELGPGYRFRTTVAGPAPVAGVIEGDVYLVGGGDPILATADYAGRFRRQPQIYTDIAALADDLVALGVTRVAGSVLGDESRYDNARYVAGWPSRYITQNVVGPLSALSVNDAFVEFPTPERWRPLAPAPDPALHAAAVLTGLLEARGVDVGGDPGAAVTPAGTPELAAVESPLIDDVLEQLLLESDNSTAELLVKELGHRAGAPTTAGGVTLATSVLQDAGLELSGAALVDGSGLSLEDRATCELLVASLRHPETGARLRERLPVAGRSGTLQGAFVDTPLVGHLRAKTGSLNTVAGLAGVVQDGDGPLTFAYLLNLPAGQVVDEELVRAVQHQLGQILLDHPNAPDPRTLGPRPIR